jgi:2-polyprenyl-6-methoxyphenol hydroxylase-like FAD-dependent oxidoreductase
MRPVFGHAPAFHQPGLRARRRRLTEDRVMLIGEAAGLSSPLAFGGMGLPVRTIARLTHLTDLALKADLLDAASLAEINEDVPRAAQMASLAEFLRPTPRCAPATVNETLNAVMAALHSLDERVRRELFQDRMSFSALKRLLSRTAKLYPRIFQRVREHFGTHGMFWWLAQIATAAFSERRSRPMLLKDLADQDTEVGCEDAAREFARYVALYKSQHGVDT